MVKPCSFPQTLPSAIIEPRQSTTVPKVSNMSAFTPAVCAFAIELQFIAKPAQAIFSASLLVKSISSMFLDQARRGQRRFERSLLGQTVSRVLALNMLHILIILLTDIFQDVICLKSSVPIQSERLGVRSWVIDGSFPFQVPQVRPAIALDGMQLFGVRVPREVEPELIVESDRVNDQTVSLVLADRFAIPSWIRIRGMLAPVHENLAVAVNIALKN